MFELKIDEKISKNELIKDSLENLCLYLNEIEHIIHSESSPETEHEKKYKLQILEQYISSMDGLFKLITSEGKGENVIVS